MEEETCGILHRLYGKKYGTFLTFLLIGFCSLLFIAGIMALSLTEKGLVLKTQYGFHWRESYIRETVDNVRNPWVIACYEIREGEQTSNGALIAGVDTLIVRVQGPRRMVEAVCESLERSLW